MKVTPEMKRLMSPTDQARYFGAKLEPEPAKMAKETLRLEREEQRTFYNWLLLHEEAGELVFDWSRTDKKTTRRKGTLDFFIFTGDRRTLFIEMKLPGEKLTHEQEGQAAKLCALGHKVAICYSAKEAIEVTTLFLAHA